MKIRLYLSITIRTGISKSSSFSQTRFIAKLFRCEFFLELSLPGHLPRRIEKQVRSPLAVVIDTVRAKAIEQPVCALLRRVKHIAPAKRIGRQLVEILWDKLIKVLR